MKCFLRILAAMGLSAIAVSADLERLDPDYGAVLFQFYQADYFQSLVEFRLADAHGGIEGQGKWPALVEGGVKLSYGMESDARALFSQHLDNLADPQTRNRAWLYIARIHYERGDFDQALANWSRLVAPFRNELAGEAQYLGSLIHLKLERYDELFALLEEGVESGAYEPFVWFNAGLASVRQQRYLQAIRYFENTIDSARRDSANRWALVDRSQLALAHVYVQQGDLIAAEQAIGRVRQNGPFARLAVLTQAWIAELRDDAATSLTIAGSLSEGSVAYPETQEALLLRAALLEKQALPGRAVRAFDQAVRRYKQGYEQIGQLRDTLQQGDLLSVLVSDLDETVSETDWFGEPPVLESEALTPYLYRLMATNEFQALLKDLRDLYAIRLNLEHWAGRRDEYDIMVQAQQREYGGMSFAQLSAKARTTLDEQFNELRKLEVEAMQLEGTEKEQADATLAQLRQKLLESRALTFGIGDRSSNSIDITKYQARVDTVYTRLNRAAVRVDETIEQLERAILSTINADLDRQISGIRLYEIQARLARARLLDAELVRLYTVARDAEPAAEDAQ